MDNLLLARVLGVSGSADPGMESGRLENLSMAFICPSFPRKPNTGAAIGTTGGHLRAQSVPEGRLGIRPNALDVTRNHSTNISTNICTFHGIFLINCITKEAFNTSCSTSPFIKLIAARSRQDIRGLLSLVPFYPRP